MPSSPAERSPLQSESRRSRAGRYTRRTWLYTWVGALLAIFVLLVILIAENTRTVKVGWILGYSRVSLVFLILFAAILGWLLGVVTSVVFRRRTRPGS